MALTPCADLAPIKLEIAERFEESYSYHTEDEKNSLILKIAQAVSELFSYFLIATSDLSALGRRPRQGPYPSDEKVQRFKFHMVQAVHKNLMNTSNGYFVLSTDYSPEASLETVLKQAGITRDEFSINYHRFFPYKSSTAIVIKTYPEPHVWLNIRFEGGSQ